MLQLLHALSLRRLEPSLPPAPLTSGQNGQQGLGGDTKLRKGRMGLWLTSAVQRSSPLGTGNRSAGIVHMARRLSLPAAPRTGGGTSCCTARITAVSPARATGRGLLRAARAKIGRADV